MSKFSTAIDRYCKATSEQKVLDLNTPIVNPNIANNNINTEIYPPDMYQIQILGGPKIPATIALQLASVILQIITIIVSITIAVKIAHCKC